MRCSARINKPKSREVVGFIKELLKKRVLCEQPARWITLSGEPVCDEHANEIIDGVMSDDTILGMALKARGQRPESRDVARRRYLRPLD